MAHTVAAFCRKHKGTLGYAEREASVPLMPFFLSVAESAELSEAIAQLPMEWAFWSVRQGRKTNVKTRTKCAFCNNTFKKPVFMRVSEA